MMKDNRDALDFGIMNVPRLFVKLFIPTLMGLIFSAILLLRGVIFVIPSFILLPMALGDKGLWIAMPLSEMLTFGVILLSLLRDRRK